MAARQAAGQVVHVGAVVAPGVREGGEDEAGMGAAYAFSSQPEMVKYVASTNGGAKLRLECDDFANEKEGAMAAVAMVYANDVAKGRAADVYCARRLGAPRRGGCCCSR